MHTHAGTEMEQQPGAESKGGVQGDWDTVKQIFETLKERRET